MNKFFKIMIIPLLIAVSITIVYIVIDYGSSDEIVGVYEGIKPDSTSGFNKALQFLESYTQATGDTSLAIKRGLSEEDAEIIASGGTVQNGGNLATNGVNPDNNPSLVQPISSNDYRPGAQAVAMTYKNSSGVFDYSQSASSNGKWSYNGKEHNSSHRDCSCFCSAMCYIYGYESAYVHRTSVGFSSAYTGYPANNFKVSDLRPGDILWRSEHVAMVVYNDGTTCYVADCGKTSRIEDTANKGYTYTYSCADTLSVAQSKVSSKEWRSVRRPGGN